MNPRLAAIPPVQEKAIRKLPLTGIESLAEALLEFAAPADLARWLKLHKS